MFNLQEWMIMLTSGLAFLAQIKVSTYCTFVSYTLNWAFATFITSYMWMNNFGLFFNFWFLYSKLHMTFTHNFRFHLRNKFWYHLFNLFFQKVLVNLGFWYFGWWHCRDTFDLLLMEHWPLFKLEIWNFVLDLICLVIKLNLLSLVIEVFIYLFNEDFDSFLWCFL